MTRADQEKLIAPLKGISDEQRVWVDAPLGDTEAIEYSQMIGGALRQTPLKVHMAMVSDWLGVRGVAVIVSPNTTVRSNAELLVRALNDAAVKCYLKPDHEALDPAFIVVMVGPR